MITTTTNPKELKAEPATLSLFPDPAVLAEIGHVRLARFMKHYAADLAAVGIDLPAAPNPDDVHDPNPAPDSEHGIYYRSIARLFSTSDLLPERLLNDCRALESATTREGCDCFEEIRRRRFPNVGLSATCPLDRVLEMWFLCPEELTAFFPPDAPPGLNAESAKPAKDRKDDSALESSSIEHSAPTVNAAPTSEIIDRKSEIINAPPFTTGATLLHNLEQLLPRYVILPAHAAETLALWIVHTWCFQFRDVSTYIGVESPEKRCGKTTLLGVLSKLVHRPVVASNISPSAFFRVIEELQPTLLIDEADTFLQANDELRGILNAGYHKPTAHVIRVASMQNSESRRQSSDSEMEEKEIRMGTTRPKVGFPSSSLPSTIDLGQTGSVQLSASLATYSTWCPKFIAAIGQLPETLADRCIVIRMQRKREGRECARMRDLDGAELRDQCARFAMEHGDAIAGAKPEVPKSLNDRAADIWEPLFAIADLAGSNWPEEARAAASALTVRSRKAAPAAACCLTSCTCSSLV